MTFVPCKGLFQTGTFCHLRHSVIQLSDSFSRSHHHPDPLTDLWGIFFSPQIHGGSFN